MGGFRTDGKLLDSLQKAVDVLWEMGYDELSNDVEEAIARLIPVLNPDALAKREGK